LDLPLPLADHQTEQNRFNFTLANATRCDRLAPSVEPPMASTARCQSDARPPRTPTDNVTAMTTDGK
jgi:hypothetical protein